MTLGNAPGDDVGPVLRPIGAAIGERRVVQRQGQRVTRLDAPLLAKLDSEDVFGHWDN